MKSALRHNVVGSILAVLILVTLFIATSLLLQPVAAQGPGGTPTVGKPWRGAPGITETVAQIMERERNAPPVAPAAVRASPRLTDHRKLQRVANPAAPQIAQVGTPQESVPNRLPSAPNNPQAVGTSFLGAQLSESGFIPPDSMGVVGSTQVLVVVNGRIKVFSKVGVLGALNVTLDSFFNSVMTLGSHAVDPHVRYDRFSGRWFITAIDTANVNRILIAVSSGSTITDPSSFAFYQFQHDQVGTTPNADTGLFADYDTLGVDKFALYIGVNMFTSAGFYQHSSVFVVRKSDLLSGTLTVTPFRDVTNGITAGPLTPQGVDNDDPAATGGYFIGVDVATFGLLDIRRITNPGGTPSISGNFTITVPTTYIPFPFGQPAQGSTTQLDALDDRLFAAAMHKNKISGTNSLWTAHNIQVDSSGAGCSTCTGGARIGSRWYEITNLTATPTLNQAGTLFDPATTNPRGFWIPSVAMSGQGHMGLGSSTASPVDFAGIAVAGRFSSDPAGTIQPFTLAQPGLGSYNLLDSSGFNRWGDYSQTVVDPNDDMTMWTFQEYANATNSWGVRVIQLKAPPPARPISAAPSSVLGGQSSVNVVITGSSVSGSGFFDPGPDTGGPGFTNHITASVSGGVIVNSVTFNSPTQLTLNISTVNASGGAQSITVTNPDGQSSTGYCPLMISGGATNTSPCNVYFPVISK